LNHDYFDITIKPVFLWFTVLYPAESVIYRHCLQLKLIHNLKWFVLELSFKILFYLNCNLDNGKRIVVDDLDYSTSLMCDRSSVFEFLTATRQHRLANYPASGNQFQNTRYPAVFDFQKILPNNIIFIHLKDSYFI